MLNPDPTSLRFESVLRLVGRNPIEQSKFVNTLSFLEYIGARKILKSQKAEFVNADILTHAAEEIRHAKILKQVAVRMSGGTLHGYSASELLCGKEAEIYIQSLDQAICNSIGKEPRLNYLYTTLLIEKRALVLYPMVQSIFENSELSRTIQGILGEEDRHLADVRNELDACDPDLSTRIEEFHNIECHFFGRWIDQMADHLDT